jgi:actin-related protein 6
VGGKLLTNHLKEIVSYRQLHVLDETHVMNFCKEDCCFVSLDFDGDMRKAATKGGQENSIARDYVLPDFTTIR